MKRLLITSLLLVLLLALTFVVAPTYVAHASSSGPLTCLGTSNVQFSPALTNTPQTVDVTIDELYGPCPVSPDPQLTGGSLHLEATRPNASCTALLGGSPEQRTFHWSNGSSSTVTFTLVSVNRLVNGTTQVIETGSVTSGFDRGFLVTKTVTFPTFSLACDTTGLSSNSGPVVLAFVGL